MVRTAIVVCAGGPVRATLPVLDPGAIVIAADAGEHEAERLGLHVDLLVGATSNNEVRLYDGRGQSLPAQIELPLHIHSVSLSPAGDRLAVGSHEGELHLYELPTFRLLWSRAVRAKAIVTVEFTRQADVGQVTRNDDVVQGELAQVAQERR